MPDDRLYDLLPAFDRLRDAEVGGPLQALLGVIGDQAAALEAGIAQLYDDWFIETCQDWLIPYFADLVEVALGPTAAGTATLNPLDAASRRGQVANAIRDRRAKGTLAAVERFATDTADWPCRAIEFAWLVAATQPLRHPDLNVGGTMPIGDAEALDGFGTPFSRASYTADMHRICSHRTRGTHNLPSIGVAVWRLAADGVDQAPAECVNDDNHFTFDALGHDTQLCVAPVPRAPGTPPASDLDVPAPISRITLARRLEDYYGEARSLCVYRGRSAVGRADVVVADLAHWRHRLAPSQVAIDPVLGRIAFPVRDVPEDGVLVSYRRLTVGGIGGGQYPRSLAPPAGACYHVSMTGQRQHHTVGAAFAAWRADQGRGRAGAQATIEILDDGVYEERLNLELRPGEVLEIRSADGHRPVLRPVGEEHDRPESLRVAGLGPSGEQPARPRAGARRARRSGSRSAAAGPGDAAEGRDAAGGGDAASSEDAAEHGSAAGSGGPVDSGGAGGSGSATESRGAAAGAGTAHPALPAPEVTFDGIWVARHPVELTGRLGRVTFRHCTLVPAASGRRPGGEVSLRVAAMPVTVSIEFSVLGRVQVISPETGFDPVPVTAADSILDAGGPAHRAVEGAERRPAWASLSLRRVTVLGSIDVREVGVITGSILLGRFDSARRQVGHVSFCYVPEDSRTPRRSSCQPDGVLAAVDEAIARGTVPAAERTTLRSREAARVTPRFDSVRFGAPAYARLVTGAPPELACGAQDGGELGAYHMLWLSYREAQLQSGLPAYAPIGMDIRPLYAT
jgi:hypothetical protein